MAEQIAPAAAIADSRTAGRLRPSLIALRDYGVLAATAAIFIALALLSPAFLTTANLLNILDQNAAIGIIACGGTLVMIAGGFDLSVGAIFALSGVIAEVVP